MKVGEQPLDDAKAVSREYEKARLAVTCPEIAACRRFLERELSLMPQVRVVVALGRIAFDNYLDILRARNSIRSRAAYLFGHNVVHEFGDALPALVGSYHPSQQNTFTGKLTAPMFDAIFRRARAVLTS